MVYHFLIVRPPSLDLILFPFSEVIKNLKVSGNPPNTGDILTATSLAMIEHAFIAATFADEVIPIFSRS
jgi:hypothetical protein